MAEKKETKEQKLRAKEFDREEKEKKRQIEPQDPLSNYLKYSNLISDPYSPEKQCEISKKAIGFGLKLLPINFDDDENQEGVDALRSSASELLDKGIDDLKISMDFADEGKDLARYSITSVDDDKIKFEVGFEHGVIALDTFEGAFTRQLHRKYLTKLQKIENEVGIALVKYDVVPRMTRKQLMDKMITKKFERRYLREIKKGAEEGKKLQDGKITEPEKEGVKKDGNADGS